MVPHTGAADGPRRLRSLNRPRPLRVEAEGGGPPQAVQLSGRRLAVEAVLQTWRIDDEWWRPRPVSRLYFSLLLEDGRTLVAYRDLVSGRWWTQRY